MTEIDENDKQFTKTNGNFISCNQNVNKTIDINKNNKKITKIARNIFKTDRKTSRKLIMTEITKGNKMSTKTARKICKSDNKVTITENEHITTNHNQKVEKTIELMYKHQECSQNEQENYKKHHKT